MPGLAGRLVNHSLRFSGKQFWQLLVRAVWLTWSLSSQIQKIFLSRVDLIGQNAVCLESIGWLWDVFSSLALRLPKTDCVSGMKWIIPFRVCTITERALTIALRVVASSRVLHETSIAVLFFNIKTTNMFWLLSILEWLLQNDIYAIYIPYKIGLNCSIFFYNKLSFARWCDEWIGKRDLFGLL